MSIFAITNTRNLVRIIALGCIGPRAIYGDKYAPDGTELAEGQLILWRSAPPASTIAAIHSNYPNYPVVIVELQGPDLPDDVVSYDGVLPRQLIRAVHFATEQNRDDFASTPFDNADPGSLSLKVSPELFDIDYGSSDGSGQFSLLGQTSGPTTDPISVEPSQITQSEVDVLDRLVGGALEAARPPLANTATTHVAAQVWNDTARGRSALDALTHTFGEGATQMASAVAETIYGHPFGDRLTRRFLEEVTAVAPASYEHELERGVRVLRGREPLGDLDTWSDPVTSALVLAALREQPESLRDEFRSATDGAQPVVQLALWFCGLLSGRGRRPWQSREPLLEEHASIVMAHLLRTNATCALELPPLNDVTAHVHSSQERWTYVLRLGHQEIEIGSRGFIGARERLRQAAESDHSAAVAEALGVPVTTVVHSPASTRVTAVHDNGEVTMQFDGTVSIERTADTDDVVRAIESWDDLSSLQTIAEELTDTEEAP